MNTIALQLREYMFSFSRGLLPGRLYKVRDKLFQWLSLRIRGVFYLNGNYFDIDTHIYHDRALYTFGVYEVGTSRYIKNYVSNMTAGVVLDIGANIGIHTLNMCKSRKTNLVKVIAFEPNSLVYRKLSNNIALNGLSNVEPFNMALSNHAENLSLYTEHDDDVNTYTNPGVSSCYKKDKLKYQQEIEAIDADSLLADYVNDIKLVKIDTEGAEYKILQGMQSILAQSKPALIVEYKKSTYDQISAFLAKYKYEMIGSLCRYGIDKTRLTENILFLPT